MRPVALVLTSLLAGACGRSAAPPSKPPEPSVSRSVAKAPRPKPKKHTDGALDKATRLAVFDDVVAQIRRHHEFAEPAFANLSRKWDDDVVELRARMADATSPTQVLRTLDELQNSLLDVHLHFAPLGEDDPRHVLLLPLRFGVEPGEGPGSWQLYVTQVPPEYAERVKVGDLLVSVDGVDVPALLREHRFSNAFNQPRSSVELIASHLVQRRWTYWSDLDRKTVKMLVAPRGGGTPVELKLKWTPAPQEPDSLDDGVSLAPQCDGVPPRDYGPYTLAAVGARVCIYTSRAKPYARFPIVRAHSFLYGEDERLVRLDYDIIRKTLAAVPRVEGVLVDLRDNHGGNNPHVFLDWWASAPYDNMTISLKLDAELAKLEGPLDRALWSSAVAQQYRERQKRGETAWEYPFLCSEGTCDDGNRRTPKNRVTKAPVALLVGPLCISSCDTFAQTFSRHDFGPLVGSSTAAAYTVVRLPVIARTEDGRVLGTLHVALSRSRIGDGPWIEAVPLPIDVPLEETFATRGQFDRNLVDAGIGALRKRPRPRAR